MNRNEYLNRMGIEDNLEKWNNTLSINPEPDITNKISIYFDMDGTLAVFNKGKTMEEIFSPGYFRNLEPNKNIVSLAKQLCADENVNVYVLSKSSYEAIQEKIDWLEEYIPEIHKENIVFVPLEANKRDFIPNSFNVQILIDDYNKNLNDWDGLAVKCVTDVNNENPDYDSIFYNLDVEDNICLINDSLEKYINDVDIERDVIDNKYCDLP